MTSKAIAQVRVGVDVAMCENLISHVLKPNHIIHVARAEEIRRLFSFLSHKECDIYCSEGIYYVFLCPIVSCDPKSQANVLIHNYRNFLCTFTIYREFFLFDDFYHTVLI